MGPFFWPVTCAHMGKQLNPQPSYPGKVGGKSPPPPPPPGRNRASMEVCCSFLYVGDRDMYHQRRFKTRLVMLNL